MKEKIENLPTVGKDLPAGTMAMVSSSDFATPTAENSGPGKNIIGKLDTQTRN